MKTIKLTLFIFIFGLALPLQAQNISEILRYSMTNYGSTARALGVGNTLGALGADFSTASSNPAGMAEFRKSEFMIGMGPIFQKTKGTYENQTQEENTNNFLFENVGLVMNNRPIASRIKRVNFYFGVNKTADFNQKIYFDGLGSGSIVQRFLENADGNTPDELDDFEDGLAFEVGAIHDFDDDGIYESDFTNFNIETRKTQEVRRTGGINELLIGLAANANDKFSFGATVGFPTLSYKEIKNYKEFDAGNSIDIFDFLEYDESLEVEGVGINLKGGFIYKPMNDFRLGLALHTPTLYTVTDKYFTDMRYVFTDNTSQDLSAQSPFNEFSYSLSTPWKTTFSAGYIFRFGSIKGFVSGELDYINYTAASFNLSAESLAPIDLENELFLNNQIDNTFQSAWNYRIGTELAVHKFRLRGGINNTASPYNDNSGTLSNTAFQFGLGYRANKYYFDFGGAVNSYETGYNPYNLSDPSNNPFVLNKTNNTKLIFTFGYKMG